MLYDPAYSGMDNMEMSKMSKDDVNQAAVNETAPQTANETLPQTANETLPQTANETLPQTANEPAPPEVEQCPLLAEMTPRGFNIKDIVGAFDIWVRRQGGVPGEVAALRQEPDGRWKTVEVVKDQARLAALFAIRRK
jgi:hypothetical protein